jgi:hypothetical protein
MAEPKDEAEAAALWRRWRAAETAPPVAAPDALTLAAYVEARLDPHAAEAVEAWLSDNPLAFQDILAVRRAAAEPPPEVPAAVVARAMALVDAGDARVVRFGRLAAPMRSWHSAIGWGAVAASMLLTSLVGFALGNDTYVSLSGNSQPTLGQELFDPPTGLFGSVDEDSAT